jgi:hypothetical protein
MDSQLIFWLVVSLVSALAWWERLNAAGAGAAAAARRRNPTTTTPAAASSLLHKAWLETGQGHGALHPSPAHAWWDLTSRILLPPGTPLSAFERSMWCVGRGPGLACVSLNHLRFSNLSTYTHSQVRVGRVDLRQCVQRQDDGSGDPWHHRHRIRTCPVVLEGGGPCLCVIHAPNTAC